MSFCQRTFLAALLVTAAACSSGSDTDSLYNFAPGAGCTGCHSSRVSPELDPFVTNGTGTPGKHTRHVMGAGITCVRCHSGYLDAGTHMNRTTDTGNPAVLLVRFDATNPAGSWTNDTGPRTGQCAGVDCHGGITLDWYGGLPVCAACHFTQMGTRRPVVGVAGDFASNPTTTSHHVSGAGDPTPDQCMVCHDMSRHREGAVRLWNADTGAVIAYDAAAPSTAETFCLSCHDADGSQVSGVTPTSPFNDGSIMGQAPYRASAGIRDDWNKTFGHRQQGLTCIGSGAPNTGCHGNGHGTAYKGLLARNVTLPQPKTNWYAYQSVDEPDYDLCFTCHASYPRVTKEAIFGVRLGGNYDPLLDMFSGVPAPYYTSGIQTLFRDRNVVTTQTRTYEDYTYFSGYYTNLHFYHVQVGPGAWNYRDSIPSSIVCLSCHSVHGSNTRYGWVYDSVQFDHHAGAGSDVFGMIGAPLNTLGNYPTGCAINCHDIFGPTSSWFEPSGE